MALQQNTPQVTKNNVAEVSALGVGGVTPVVPQATIADPSGGATVDAEARTAIDAILVVLETFGFTLTA